MNNYNEQTANIARLLNCDPAVATDIVHRSLDNKARLWELMPAGYVDRQATVAQIDCPSTYVMAQRVCAALEKLVATKITLEQYRALNRAAKDCSCRLTVDELYKGRLCEPKLDPLNEGKKLLVDMKITKYAARYAETYGLPRQAVDTFVTIWAEELFRLQQRDVTVRLSVMPTDLLMCSEHTTGWTSCHSLKGMHRTGALSYTLDDCTAIAYTFERERVCAATGTMMPVKLWRQMIYFGYARGCVVFGKQYPYKSVGAVGVVEQMLQELLGAGVVVNCDRTHVSFEPAEEWTYVDIPEKVLKTKEYRDSCSPGQSYIPCTGCGKLRGFDVEDNEGLSFLCPTCRVAAGWIA